MLSLKKKPVLELRKDAEDAQQAKGLYGVEANIVVAMDRSGSMDDLYRNGQVQNALDRVLGLALAFDPDGKAPVLAFHNNVYHVGDISLANHANFVEENIIRRVSAGGTSYAPVIADILKKFGNPPSLGSFFTGNKTKAKNPTYVLFFTDGDNDDHAKTEALIKESRGHAIFWQFVGLGNASFSFLKRLDDMRGAGLDNADFFPFGSGPNEPDSALYAKLLNEFPTWLKAAKKAGLC